MTSLLAVCALKTRHFRPLVYLKVGSQSGHGFFPAPSEKASLGLQFVGWGDAGQDCQERCPGASLWSQTLSGSIACVKMPSPAIAAAGTKLCSIMIGSDFPGFNLVRHLIREEKFPKDANQEVWQHFPTSCRMQPYRNWSGNSVANYHEQAVQSMVVISNSIQGFLTNALLGRMCHRRQF